MKIGLAEGIFANINGEEYTDKEKAEAIYLVIQKNKFKELKKEHLVEVVKWLFARCFRIREQQ